MRWIFRGIGLILILAVVAIAAFFLVPADKIAALVEEQFEASTGRALSISGDVRPGLWPEIGVNTGAVTIANPEWAGEAPMIEAEGISAGVDWTGLFGGDIRITGVELLKPTIRLKLDEAGRGNWELATGSDPSATEGTATADDAAPTRIALDNARISDGTVIFESPGAAPITLSGIDATITLPDYDGPLALELTANSNGEAIAADLTLDGLSQFLAGTPVATRLDAKIGSGSVAFEGQAGLTPLVANGQINANLPGLSGLTRAAGAGEAALPKGLGQDAIAVAGALAFEGESLGLSGANITLDSNSLSGDIAVGLGGARPKLTANLSGGPLDLSGLGGDAPSSESTAGSGWSTAPIDVSGLGAIDAEIQLTAQAITLPDSKLGRTSLGITLDDRRLVTSIRELLAYDGQVQGQIVVNGRGGLSASTDLSGSAIAISRLFAELLDFDKLVALGDMQIKILTSGNSMNALMNGMNGDGRFRFGAGELLGLDLVGMVRNLDPSLIGNGKSTIFDEITGTFRIVDGVVINENLEMLAPLLTATGAGQIGLGGQTLNYRIVPKILDGDGDGISVPVLVTGTWAAPKFRLDIEGLIDEKAQAEIDKAKAEAEAKAKAKVEEKVQEKLGLQAGESVEDKAKDKLEDELKKGLKSLFD